MLEGVLNKSIADGVRCRRKVASKRNVVGAVRLLINARGLQLECARVLYEVCSCMVLCMVVRQ